MSKTVRVVDGVTTPKPDRRTLRRIYKDVPLFLSLSATTMIVLVALLAPVISPYDPLHLDIASALRPPSPGAWFGTDEAGRDVLSRTIWGARLSLVSAAGVLVIASSLGSAVGIVSGYRGGAVDQVLMRLTDLFFAFPGLLLAIAITTALGPSPENAILSIALVWWPVYARLVRSRTLSVKENLYIEAARALGLSEARILFKHILPQSWGIIVARLTVDIGHAILLTASLGFLGLGNRAPSPEWGSMIAASRPYFLSYWWTATFPGLAMLITVVVFSLAGDTLYESLGVSKAS